MVRSSNCQGLTRKVPYFPLIVLSLPVQCQASILRISKEFLKCRTHITLQYTLHQTLMQLHEVLKRLCVEEEEKPSTASTASHGNQAHGNKPQHAFCLL